MWQKAIGSWSTVKKSHETYQNVHFSSFRQLVRLAVGRWFIFFPRATSRSEAETNIFSHRFWWVGRETRNKNIFLGHRIVLPCCGYSLESHWRCVFNEYLQLVLWRNKQNYPLIITKYPPYQFHFTCAQRRLRSACASAQSEQSLRCPLIEQLRSQGFFIRTAKTLIRMGGCPAWFESSLGA